VPFNGSGVFTPPAADFPAVPNTLIQSSKFNNVVNDLVNNGLSFTLTKDGQQISTANQPMGAFRHTGVGATNASGQYGRVDEIQDGSFLYGGTAGGTADALTISTVPSFSAYTTGMTLFFKSSASPNTGAATLQVNGIAGPKAIQNNGSALAAGMIEASKFYSVIYDGTAFQLTKVVGAVGIYMPLAGGAATGAITTSGSGTILGIGTGARMTFQQTSAPTGWTKETSATYNDAALRFQTGTVTTGGAAGFIATMNAAGATATDGSGTSGGFTLTTTEMPSHTHPADTTIGSGGVQVVAEAGSRASSLITGATGGGGSHSHSTPTHSHVLNSFNLKFVDCIIATKD